MKGKFISILSIFSSSFVVIVEKFFISQQIKASNTAHENNNIFIIDYYNLTKKNHYLMKSKEYTEIH